MAAGEHRDGVELDGAEAPEDAGDAGSPVRRTEEALARQLDPAGLVGREGDPHAGDPMRTTLGWPTVPLAPLR